MKTVRQHLESEKLKSKPSELRIKELEKILKRGTITLKQFKMTGRFIPFNEYTQENSSVELIKDCKEVIEYIGASIIQVLPTGDFVFEDTTSKNLDEVEEKLFWSVAQNLWG